MNEEDPKEVAKKARRLPATEKTLRQFLSMESGNYARREYRENYDAAFSEPAPIQPRKCSHCDYLATTLGELTFHVRVTGHGFFADSE